jgi:hypothetical protein
VFDIKMTNAFRPLEGFIPNPKLKLLSHVSELMCLRRYLIRTESTCRNRALKRHFAKSCRALAKKGELLPTRAKRVNFTASRFLSFGSTMRQALDRQFTAPALTGKSPFGCASRLNPFAAIELEFDHEHIYYPEAI